MPVRARIRPDWYRVAGLVLILLSAMFSLWLIWNFCQWAANTVVITYDEFAAPITVTNGE